MSTMAGLDMQSDYPWLLAGNSVYSRAEFFARAAAWANELPDTRYMLLLCEQRLHFLLGFIAAQLRRQTVLLPSNCSPGAIAELIKDYPESYYLVDDARHFDNLDRIHIDNLPASGRIAPEQDFSPQHISAIAFTSGSTGKAAANVKYWDTLVRGAMLARLRFGFGDHHHIVSTVPPQHMYGLETTIMVPLVTGARISSARPFYPDDVRSALERSSGQRILITTPIHLRACLAAQIPHWPKVSQIISATAPLDTAIAREAEAVFKAPVQEIFGCTEAGSVASRRTVDESEWHLYDSFRIENRRECAYICAPHLPTDVELADVIELTGETSFRLMGRKSDLVNIAGKRASLRDLTMKLNSLDGVQDGVILMPEHSDEHRTARLTAMVVAPGKTSREILDAFAALIDPVFLPRPLHVVDSLPRNDTGKLPREQLLHLLHELNCQA